MQSVSREIAVAIPSRGPLRLAVPGSRAWRFDQHFYACVFSSPHKLEEKAQARGRRRETETRSAAQIAARTVAKHNASVRARHREAQDSAPRPLVQFVSPTALRATDRGGNFASDVLRRRVGRQAAAASPVGHAARDPAQLHHARGQDAAHSRFWPHVQILRHIPREARPRIRDVRGPGT